MASRGLILYASILPLMAPTDKQAKLPMACLGLMCTFFVPTTTPVDIRKMRLVQPDRVLSAEALGNLVLAAIRMNAILEISRAYVMLKYGETTDPEVAEADVRAVFGKYYRQIVSPRLM